MALATEYSNKHNEELTQAGERVVVFVDIGYAKTSVFVVGFIKSDCRLLDSEHMQFLGSRNMNNILTEHYE